MCFIVPIEIRLAVVAFAICFGIIYWVVQKIPFTKAERAERRKRPR